MTRKHGTTASHGTPAQSQADGRASPASKRPVLRFILLFAGLVIPFNLIYYAYYQESGAYRAYLTLNARASAAVLRLFGTPAESNGLSVKSPRFGLVVAQGCDAIQPCALFLCAVLASPVVIKRKLPGILIGVPLLLALNLVRIVTLFYTGVYRPHLFELMHLEVWQALFIVLALLFWIVWARWATGGRKLRPHVTA